MQKPFRIESYMAVNPATIGPTETLRSAIGLMSQTKTYCLIVTDPDRRVIGIVSLTDIIGTIVPDYLEGDEHVAPFASESLFPERVKAVADRPVESFMTKKVFTIEPDDTIMQAAAMLSETKVRQLPVVDRDARLVGYIGRTRIREAIDDVLNSRPQ